MYSARLNDPLQLTVFDPSPSDFDAHKEESLLGKIFRHVTGSQVRMSNRTNSNGSRQSSVADLSANATIPSGSLSASVSDFAAGRREASGGSLFSPGGTDDNAVNTLSDMLNAAAEEDVSGGFNRTLGSVLQRLKAIASKGNLKNPQPFQDNDFKHYWVPDSLAKDCFECEQKFTPFRRRRHCRVCGQVFCGRCADQEVPGHLLGFSGSLRMCSFCSQVVLSRARYLEPLLASALRKTSGSSTSYQRSADVSPSFSRHAQSDQIRYQLFSGQSQDIPSDRELNPSRKLSDELRGLSCDLLREIWLEMNHVTDGLELKIHRHRFRAFPDCVSGVEIVDWLIKHRKTTTRKSAVRIGQGLLNFKFLECLTTMDAVFVDEYVLYKPKTVTNELEDASGLTAGTDYVENEEPTWLAEIEQPDNRTRTPTVDIRIESGDDTPEMELLFPSRPEKAKIRRTDSNVSLSSQVPDLHNPPSETSAASPSASFQTAQIPEEIAFCSPPELDLYRNSDSEPHNDMDDGLISQSLDIIFQKHLHDLLHQLEIWEDLGDDWHDLIISLSVKVTENVTPSVRENHDDMDVRQYVHVKTIPGGKANESGVVFGVMCSKHVANRKMRQSFMNPKILLYGAALEFGSVENKFNSLEPVMQEEAEFLKNCVNTLSEFQPDILLVERSVSRLAQEYLFTEGITLVANVKPSIIQRISRCTGADRFSLLGDSRVLQPRLGVCSKFEVKTIDSKPYMIFDGCPKQLGCTVLLRGGSKETLRKVKRILTFGVFCQYNWKLEKAFLIDEHAHLPNDGHVIESQGSMSDNSADFATVMGSFISSVSPFIRPRLPFLLCETGARSIQRLKLSGVLFWSKLLSKTESESAKAVQDVAVPSHEEPRSISRLLPPHHLLSMHMTSGAQSTDVQKALANFRACGGRLAMTEKPLNLDPTPTEPAETPVKQLSVVDCFDIYHHQRLPILCSIHACESADVMASFCVFPWILVIYFYDRNDLTLGDFLETFYFRQDSPCPNLQCGRSVKEHVRRFASGAAAITVTARDLDNPSAVPLTRMVTWTWCRICRKISSVVPVSDATWSLSFAKYLDLRLHASAYQRENGSDGCPHSLHRDHIQYFAYGLTVVAFKLTALRLREIDSPPIVITLDDCKSRRERQELIEMTKTVNIKGHNLFATIADYITACQSLDLERLDEKLAALLSLKRAEKQLFKDWLECLQLKLASPLLKFDPETADEADQLRDFIWDIEDSVSSLKRKLTELAATWSANLNEIEVIKRKEERKTAHNLKAFQSTPEFLHDDSPPLPCTVSVLVDPPSDESETGGAQEHAQFLLGTEESDSIGMGDDISNDFIGSPKSDSSHLRHSVTSSALTVGSMPEASQLTHRGDTVDTGTNRSSSRQKSTQSSGASNIVPFPFPPNEHYCLGESDRIPVVVFDDELSSMIAFALSSTDYAVQMSQLNRPVSRESRSSKDINRDFINPACRSSSPASPNPSGTEALASAAPSQRNAGEGNAQATQDEHSVPGFSIETDSEGFEAVLKTSENPGRGKSASKQAPEPKHYIEVQFGDQVAKVYCRIYFPEEFRLFRAMVFPYGEDRFIRSLARSVAWKTAGGKSGSTFSKTADGRFVLKQMSRLEVQSFMEFGPHYFSFMAQAAKEKRPTVIAKVVGVYRIGFKNSMTGSQVKQDLLVMENLFYGRKIQQVYDLKGSLRNRLASTDAKNDAELVLLDENFLKRICDNPLYIGPHAKLFLRKALQADTEFLSNLYIMDYSLLVGVDDDRKEIIVGIIDYIRTFTWDKRLEMVVKSTSLLGGQKVLPTIVSPELYRTRFCEAMDRYFLPVPDEWYGLAGFADGL